MKGRCVMTIGERIREERERQGLSQDELAKKMGYSNRSSVSTMESASDLTLKKVKKVASALGVSPEHLMGWDAPAPSAPPTFLTKYNRLNHSGRDYIDTQLDYALSRPEFVSEKNNDIQGEETA